MKLLLAGAAGALVLGCAVQASAQSAFTAAPLSLSRFSLGVAGGTTGGSVMGAYAVNRYLTVRAEGSFIDFDHDFKSSDVTYHGRFRHNVGGGFVDLHPFANPFFVGGGFVTGQRKVKVTAQPSATATIKINGVPFPVSQVIGVDGQIDLGSTAPFAGLGFDNTYTHAGHWGFRAEAGVIFGDAPSVALNASGPFATNATVLSDLAAERASLQHDARDFRYYPVVELGVNYRF